MNSSPAAVVSWVPIVVTGKKGRWKSRRHRKYQMFLRRLPSYALACPCCLSGCVRLRLGGSHVRRVVFVVHDTGERRLAMSDSWSAVKVARRAQAVLIEVAELLLPKKGWCFVPWRCRGGCGNNCSLLIGMAAQNILFFFIP